VIYIIFCGFSRRLLRFRLMQVYVPSLDRYFLPLPKLTDAQMAILTSHLEGRGFEVRQGSGPGRRVAAKVSQRIAIDGALGLATSAADVLDALAPAVPAILAAGGLATDGRHKNASAPYFSVKRSGASAELQFFPRMESLRTWSCLRKDGLCGLTPDEGAVLKRLLGGAPGSSRVECVTAKPTEGSRAIQEGRRVYYRSTMPVADFLRSLRTIDSGGADTASYIPRDSILSLDRARVQGRIRPEELGEWCFSE
jgi:hypothetical protein